jgi:hypothetical protein
MIDIASYCEVRYSSMRAVIEAHVFRPDDYAHAEDSLSNIKVLEALSRSSAKNIAVDV